MRLRSDRVGISGHVLIVNQHAIDKNCFAKISKCEQPQRKIWHHICQSIEAMGRELQKKKNRSSIPKIKIKNKSKSVKKRVNPLGNAIIAANWYVGHRTEPEHLTWLSLQEQGANSFTELPPTWTVLSAKFCHRRHWEGIAIEDVYHQPTGYIEDNSNRDHPHRGPRGARPRDWENHSRYSYEEAI